MWRQPSAMQFYMKWKCENAMRYGFTTGSCAAAAAKAAAYMLLTGKEKTTIQIDTPKGTVFLPEIVDTIRTEKTASCAVRKDGGDDPDITTGALIYAEVLLVSEDLRQPIIEIEGGHGVGRVTKPGLDQPVGEAAINHVPREMIHKEVLEVCNLTDFKGHLLIIISVPEGEALAEKTFNPRLGITGGISILGTTGIVEPMSSQALLATIKAELSVRYAMGYEAVAVTPGNYGMNYMKNAYGYDLNQSVKCSNFIGDTIDMASEMGIRKLLLTGHIGKLIKLSGGIMNTHSKEGDCRMELLMSMGIRAGITVETANALLGCVTTEEAVRILKEAVKLKETMQVMMEKVCFHLRKRAEGKIRIECIIYANEFGELARSEGAQDLLEQIKEYEPI